MSGAGEGREWEVTKPPSPSAAASSPQPSGAPKKTTDKSPVSASGVESPVQGEVSSREPHLLTRLVKNPASTVESQTLVEVCELYRAVAASLSACVGSDAAGASPDAKTAQHVCFLLQCSAYLSLHILRPSSAVDGSSASDVELVKEMADRVLEALEWAGRTSSASAGVEAIRALSVICADRNITQETMLTASDKIQSHKKVPLEDLLVLAPAMTARVSPEHTIEASAQDAPSVRSSGFSPQLSRLIRPLGTGWCI
jgi:hypothetical protein